MNRPQYDVDLYGDDAIADPYPHYAALRELGPAVWLPRHELWAVSRFADVRSLLRDHATFSSARGVAANDVVNRVSVGNTVQSDPPAHTAQRNVVRAPLAPAMLPAIAPRIEAEAEALVERLCGRRSFDAIADLARHLPTTIVSELVGLPDEGRAKMLRWAASTFDALGPMNARAERALPEVAELRAWCERPDTVARLRPEGWAAAIWKAAEAGAVPVERCPSMMRDYISPSLDTTILATGSLVWLFGRHPEQWDRVRAEPTLIPNAINEAVRLESPIRGFTRCVTRDTNIDGVALPAGSRVLALYASANRDERKWAEPDRFDVARDVREHLGFGFGIHVCVGMHLAKLEMTALFGALASRVARFELGEPVLAMNNVLHGFDSLPVTVHPDTTTTGDRTT